MPKCLPVIDLTYAPQMCRSACSRLAAAASIFGIGTRADGGDALDAAHPALDASGMELDGGQIRLDASADGGAGAAAMVVQTKSPGFARASSLPIPIMQTTGNLLVAAPYWDTSANTVTITDTLGLAFHDLALSDVPSGCGTPGLGSEVRLWWAQIEATGTNTLTLAQTAGSNPLGMYLVELANIDPVNPVEAVAGAVAAEATSQMSTRPLVVTRPSVIIALEDHESGERGEPLVFEPNLRDRVDGRDNLWSAQPHGSGPLRVVVGVFTTSFYTTQRPYFYASHRRESADHALLYPSVSRGPARNAVRVTQLAGERGVGQLSGPKIPVSIDKGAADRRRARGGVAGESRLFPRKFGERPRLPAGDDLGAIAIDARLRRRPRTLLCGPSEVVEADHVAAGGAQRHDT